MRKKHGKVLKIKVKDLEVLVEPKKGIKYMYLKVSAYDASVKVTTSRLTHISRVEEFVLDRYDRITEAVEKYKRNLRYVNYEYISGEKHHLLWGNEYSLELKGGKKNEVTVHDNSLLLYTKKEESQEKLKDILNEFYRKELIERATPLIEKYLKIMNLEISEFRTKNMKTVWGTCNIKDRRIWLSLGLAKKPPICLEYVIVHELSHLLERGHNKKFYSIIDSYFPNRKEAEDLLKIK